jgi:hypothetical protein
MSKPNLVPSRVCGHCGRPLSRGLCEQKFQSVGICPLCELNFLERHPAVVPPSTAAFGAFMILVIGFWVALLLWVARINGVL